MNRAQTNLPVRVCLHGNRYHWGFSAVTMKNAANSNRHCDLSHTLSWMWLHHTHAHTQNTWSGCHGARNVFFVFFNLIQVWPCTRRKMKFTLSLVFSEGSKSFFDRYRLPAAVCTHLSVQPFTLVDGWGEVWSVKWECVWERRGSKNLKTFNLIVADLIKCSNGVIAF